LLYVSADRQRHAARLPVVELGLLLKTGAKGDMVCHEGQDCPSRWCHNAAQMATTGGMMHAGAYQLPLQGPSLRPPRLSLQTFTSDGAFLTCALIGFPPVSLCAASAVAWR